MNRYEVIEMHKPGADDDDETNVGLSSNKRSWSRKQLDRMTTFFEAKPQQEKLSTLTFKRSEIQKWKSEAQKKGVKGVECLKIINVSVLGRMNAATLCNVRSLVIEDSESTLTELPSNFNVLYPLLESFKLAWSSVKIIPPALFHYGLKVLDLNENHIQFIHGIESACSLKKLILRNNRISTLPESLGSLTQLVELDVSRNKLKDLPNCLGSLQDLELLDVSQNKIKILPESMNNLKKLTFLNVSNNLLTNLNSSLSELSKLEDLQASSNKLTSISYSFESLTSLKSILLSKNNFRNMPSCFSSLPNLEIVNMKENRLQLVSDSLATVKILILDDNQLTEIPRSVIESQNIEHLWMRNNQLTRISEEIVVMSKLKTLHLENNPELRKLPNSMIKMSSLKHLYLQCTRVDKTDDVVQNLISMVLIEFTDEMVGEKEGRTANKRSVTPEMLKICNYESFHPSERPGCISAGRRG